MSRAAEDVVRRWVDAMVDEGGPRRGPLVVQGDQVAGRFRCSGTHTGTRLGHPPTGRRFDDVDEVYSSRVRDARIVEVWGLEDTAERLRQLGLA